MSAGDNDTDSDFEEKKSYNFVMRFLIFLFIAGPASVLAFGIYGRIAMRGSVAAAERGDFTPMLIIGLWLFGLAGTAVMVFKR